MDVFAGSGTTFHATCLLNAADGGRRRCILVTNNEVDPDTATALNKAGLFRGDADFEAQGIFEKVTRPRCEAVVSGRRRDGTPVPGNHLSGRPHAHGFEENVEFYRLDYLEPDDVTLGRQFKAYSRCSGSHRAEQESAPIPKQLLHGSSPKDRCLAYSSIRTPSTTSRKHSQNDVTSAMSGS
jgi:hypothetical protein